MDKILHSRHSKLMTNRKHEKHNARHRAIETKTQINTFLPMTGVNILSILSK